MSDKTLADFFLGVTSRAKRTKERHGQATFNHLLEVRPDLAEQVRGTDKDPFYLYYAEDGERWQRFMIFLRENW